MAEAAPELAVKYIPDLEGLFDYHVFADNTRSLWAVLVLPNGVNHALVSARRVLNLPEAAAIITAGRRVKTRKLDI